MVERSSIEVQEDCIESMGSELGPIFYRLWFECSYLHTKWHEFDSLYGTGRDNINLMNEAARGFFRMLQDVLLENILIHISALLDPAVQRKKRNLTLGQLPELVDPDLTPQVHCALSECARLASFAQDWRNRQIAHRDLDLALKRSPKPLRGASRRNVSKCLEAVAHVLNIVEKHYRDSTTEYAFVPRYGDAELLLDLVQEGLEARAKNSAAFQNDAMGVDEYVRSRPSRRGHSAGDTTDG